MRKLDIMEVSISELFGWCEETHNISWNAANSLFGELIPYNSYRDFHVADCHPRALVGTIPEFHKPYALIREFMLRHRLREMRVDRT